MIRHIWIFAAMASVLISSAVALNSQAKPPTVTLCELIAKPNQYSGKSVILKGRYAVGEEYAIFTDDLCEPALDRTKPVLATFGSNYHFKSVQDKRFSQLIKKNRQAMVTVLGIFTDPGRNVGHQGCCRYKLEVQRIIDAEEARSSTSGS